ncbi:MAG: glycoside hydrolase family 3 protein, partial [Spirochaetota bacterium]
MFSTTRTRFALTRAGLTPFVPVVPYDEAERRAQKIVGEMTDEEKFDMVCGRGFYIAGCERVGVPDINFTDASQGVHLRDEFPSGKLTRSVSFPSAMTLTSTWNRKLVAEYARSVGEECRAGGIHVLLGPGMNIYRIAQCGRNFEYTGEDPLLAAEMIFVYVTALQQTGVIATLKHFIGNETDYIRKHSNTVVGRRALKEIYLRAFEAGVDAGALAVMTSYNYLNGEYAGQSAEVINGLLRDELGFRHLVMTDWTSVDDGKKLAASGQDLEMPRGEHLKIAREELLGSKEIDRMVTSLVRTFTMMGFLDYEHEQQAYLDNLPIHEDVAFRVACEGTVLLRNEEALPLDSGEPGSIVVTGNWATRTPLAGKGSGYVEGYANTTYAEEIEERFFEHEVTVRNPPSDAELAAADTVIVCTGFAFEGEGRDRSFRLPEGENELIARACKLAERVVVVVTSGGGVAM